MKKLVIAALIGATLAGPAFAQSWSQNDSDSTKTHSSAYAPNSAARYSDESARYRMYSNPP